jgi:hypothetical protein
MDGCSTMLAEVTALTEFRTHAQNRCLDIRTGSILRTRNSCRLTRPVNLIESSLSGASYPALNDRQAETERAGHPSHRDAFAHLRDHRPPPLFFTRVPLLRRPAF